MNESVIREARPGDESGIHEAHMRSIREVCIKDHGEEEIKGWGNRPLGDRWITPIREGHVWVVEFHGVIHGLAYVRLHEENHEKKAHIFGLYLTPEVLKKGTGSKLVELMLNKAKSAAVKEITLDSTITAHNFYKRFGFRDNGPMKWTEIGGSRVRGYPMILRWK